MDKLLKETIEQIVKEELVKMTTSESVVKTIKKGAKAGSQASDSLDKVTSSNEVGPALAAVGRAAIGAVAGAAASALDDDEDVASNENAPAGPRKKVLRKKGGKTQIVKKRKKKLPLHLRKVKPTQAKRIARKSALKRKGKQARISKKAAKTTKKGRAMGLYKKGK